MAVSAIVQRVEVRLAMLARSLAQGREKIFLNYIPRNIFVNERDITVKVHIFLCTYFEFSAAYSQVIFSIN